MWVRGLVVFLSVSWGLASSVLLLAEIVDRIRAVVEGQIITESELREAMGLRSLSDPTMANPTTDDPENNALRQLIDRKIILRRATSQPEAASVPDDEVAKEMQSLRARYPGEAVFAQRLTDLGLTRSRLQALLREQIIVLRWVETTLRPQAVVSEEEIAQYYGSVFVPQAKRNGVKDIPPRSELVNDIRKILTEQKISQLLDAWLERQKRLLTIRVL